MMWLRGVTQVVVQKMGLKHWSLLPQRPSSLAQSSLSRATRKERSSGVCECVRVCEDFVPGYCSVTLGLSLAERCLSERPLRKDRASLCLFWQ